MTSAQNSAERLVLCKASRTGMGDRLRALVCAALYAEHAGRTLVIDWRDGLYGEVGDNVFGRLFQLHNVRAQADFDGHALDVLPRSWFGRADRSLAAVYDEDGWTTWDRRAVVARYQIPFDRLDQPASAVVIWEFTQLCELQRLLPLPLRELPLAQLERYAFTRYLTFSNRVQRVVSQVVSEDSAPYVGVHVRATREFSRDKGVSIPMARFFRATDALLKQVGANRIFLATDNANVREEFCRRYGRVMEIPKWFPSPGEPMHLSDETCPDRFAMAFGAASDICALSRASGLVLVGASSFAICARALSKLDPNQEIDVSAASFSQRVVEHLKKLFAQDPLQ